YVGVAGTLNFAANQTTQTITVPLVDDGQADPTLVFSVTLSNPVGTLLGPRKTVIVAILDINHPHAATLGDFDGDGRADLALYRPRTGQWLILQSRLGGRAVSFGA